jgi:hypothetical protein
VLHRFGYTGFPSYRGRPYRQFELGRCMVHVDIPAHPTDPTMAAWFTMTQGDDLDDTLERAAHQALTEFCERHLPVLGDTTIALLPIRNEGNAVWSERVTAISDPESSTHHAGWALTARYAQHVSSLLQEVTATGAHLRLHLEECTDQVKDKNHVVKDIQKGNQELLQKNMPRDEHPWAEFRNAFRAYYIPAGVMRKKHQEFMDLKQGGRSMHDYSKQFNHLVLYVLDQVDTDEKKKDRFMIGLSTKLQERMALNTGGTFLEFVSNVMIADNAIRAHKETKKRKVVAAPSSSAPLKYRTVYHHGPTYCHTRF